jgi:Flp pilus assembly protein protease CpaA
MLHSFGYEIRWIYGLLVFSLLIAVGELINLGGGDIKLITSLIFFGDITFGLIEYLQVSMAVAAIHLLVDYARKGSVAGNLALAPTICSPMLFSLVLS